MSEISVAVADWDGRIEDISYDLSDTRVSKVYLCVEDRHVRYRRDNVIEAVQFLKDVAGVQVFLNAWGVGGLFAGETFGDTEPFSFEKWLVLASETEANGVMLDEPRIEFDDTENIVIETFAPGKKIHLAVQPERLADFSIVHDELSISSYLFGNQMRNATPTSVDTFAEDMDKAMPSEASFWVQTWDVPEGKEWVPIQLMEVWEEEFDRDINIWAWEAFRTVSSKRAPNHKQLWSNILDML